MMTLPHQITVTEAINKIEARQMTDDELLLYEKAIKEIKKKRGLGGRYGGSEHYTSGRDDYMTPPDLYEPLLELFQRDKFDIVLTVFTVFAGVIAILMGIMGLSISI